MPEHAARRHVTGDEFLSECREGAGGETEAKRAGKLRLELKTYVMQDYDVTNFRFNK